MSSLNSKIGTSHVKACASKTVYLIFILTSFSKFIYARQLSFILENLLIIKKCQ